jgi:hypothetical protein
MYFIGIPIPAACIARYKKFNAKDEAAAAI